MDKCPKFLTNLNAFRVKHEPEILMSMGLAGLTFSVVWGVKSTIKAVKVCNDAKNKEHKDKLTAKEVIKLTWKYYVPVVLTTALSIPCVILGNRVSSKRNAALAAAYTISETALSEYKEKAKEVVSEEKIKQIEEKISQDKVDKTYEKSESNNIIICDDNEMLFMDSLSGRYFKSSWNKIEETANSMNKGCILGEGMSFSVNRWFEMIGLPSVDSYMDSVGWGIDNLGGKTKLLKIHMSTAKTPDNKVCGVIVYETHPEPIW